MNKRFEHKWALLYLGAFFVLNLFFLDLFPFMHSDETWLSGLSRAMTQHGLGTTEPFFDLMPRYPHAIKLLFHMMQMPLTAVFGYNLFAVRLLSLLFGTATLYVFYRLCFKLSGSALRALLMTAVLSLDVQMIYASHFARQDIVITFCILLAVYYIISRAEKWRLRCDIAVGAIIGLSVGVHPNSLLIALAAGSLYLYYIGMKKLRWRNLALLIGVVAVFAGVFVGISFSFNPTFLPDYFKFGETLGLDMSVSERIAYFPGYFAKLFSRTSGTYYTPSVYIQLVLFGAAALGSAVFAFFKREALRLLLPLAAVLIGIIVIGRYSQPAVVLLFPLGWAMVFWLAEHLPKIARIISYAALGAAMLASSLIAVIPYLNNDYHDYIARIKQAVPQGSRVLCNLNAEFAFDQGDLRDVRNLAFLEENGLTYAEYIERNDIEYIVYAEEMDFIRERRPVWNIVYGNVVPYYDDMHAYLRDECTAVASFQSPYAMRITRYMDDRPWAVTVYRVESEDAP